MVEANYKFYLSFENSYCRDYITEKFWKVLKYQVVPIVMGAGDYSLYAPKKSYINVEVNQNPYNINLGAYWYIKIIWHLWSGMDQVRMWLQLPMGPISQSVW